MIKKLNTYLVTKLLYLNGEISFEKTNKKSTSRKSLKKELMKISGYIYLGKTWKSARKQGYYVSKALD